MSQIIINHEVQGLSGILSDISRIFQKWIYDILEDKKWYKNTK